MKENYKYKISVIVPVYNVEEYLEETIESVIHQTIGFENIQLILVRLFLFLKTGRCKPCQQHFFSRP